MAALAPSPTVPAQVVLDQLALLDTAERERRMMTLAEQVRNLTIAAVLIAVLSLLVSVLAVALAVAR
jgi:hypothetical protein